MRIVFLGNHTVGVRALMALLEEVEVVGVIAHPIDPEDGVRYESVYVFAIDKNIPVIRATGKGEKALEFVKKLKPDLLWITDYRYIIPESIINIAPYGAVNIHPSLLPKYRGRAAINWAIINGEREVGLSVHFVDNDVDTGDIIEQIKIPVADNEFIGDVLNKCYPFYSSITTNVIKLFKEGTVSRTPQIDKFPTFPKRTPEDGKIDWNNPLDKIYNLIRAVSHPYPGAFSFINGKKFFIWNAFTIKTLNYNLLMNGSVIDKNESSFKIKCNDGILEVTEYSFEEGPNVKINNGDLLG